ncbi:unnamed protein product [Thlaspi arvense]|uniref:Endoglucanase n=1 Tax=Thlaspi arvense TaxID=13288 RepID=A0AAU9T5D8_THLAR|nr:unnamed protein product [Thlaspi arvense]
MEIESAKELGETQRSWILRPPEQKKKKKVNVNLYVILGFLISAFIVGTISTTVKSTPRHERKREEPDQYALALKTALSFFEAQKSGILPKQNVHNVSWRGDSCTRDGKGDPGEFYKDLVGGYYDAGDAIKFSFPTSYAMTLLSWSVIEYSAKYEAAGELEHVGSGDTRKGSLVDNEHYCWIRPEDIDYKRTVASCYGSCPYLAAEMSAALASASIVFKEDTEYSKKLVDGAKRLYAFADSTKLSQQHREASEFYQSTLSWDELLWSGTWLYYATGSVSYLDQVTTEVLATRAGAFETGAYYGVFSWDNKLPGAQLLLTRLRLFLGPPYPYEEMLSTFHKQIGVVMCSYLPYFHKFNRTKGEFSLIEVCWNVANAAFLATLFSDYLEAANTPGWYCGPTFYPNDVLREFSRSQIDYILGRNPGNMSYVVGFGDLYPKRVHHRGASIPQSVKNESCEGGWKWRDSKEENPNEIIGAMVAGPDKHDGFHDVRSNYNYTEPTLSGNAGLVAALVALSGGKTIDKNTIFSAIPPLIPDTPSPPPPWEP